MSKTPDYFSAADLDACEQAKVFARGHKEEIAEEITDLKKYPAEEHPASVFMAGSPGAGKTEWSKRIIAALKGAGLREPVRVDPDDLRGFFPGYTGKNSAIFQAGVAILVEKIYDLVLEKRQPFVFDSTFSNPERAEKNIHRAIARGRLVDVHYVYQNPENAWKFTQARESQEGRHIPVDAFVRHFLGARETVEMVRQKFGSRVQVTLIKKDLDPENKEEVIDITSSGVSIDRHLGPSYSKEDLEKLLGN